MVLLGGIYSFVGPIIGAAVLHLLQTFTNQYTPYWPTVLGLDPAGDRAGAAGRPDRPGRAQRRGPARTGHERQCSHRGTVEVVRRLRRHARRLVRAQAGETHAIIGPNGAGKTTFFNLHHRPSRPDKGAVSFEGRDLVGLPPHEDRAAGHRALVPAHQHLPRLTVFENVQVALIAHEGQQWNFWSAPAARCTATRTQALLELVGLAAEAAEIARRAELRRAEAARARDRAGRAAAAAAARRADRRHVAAGDGRDHRLMRDI